VPAARCADECLRPLILAAEANVKEQYLVSIRLIERLHRRFLDVIKAELDRLGIEDINNVQTLILFNINEEQLTVGELTVRGYYLGSNVSYNVKKLVENEYLIQERSSHDRRTTRVRLSPKGLELTSRIGDLYQRNCDELAGRYVTEDQLKQANQVLLGLERYWSSQIVYGPAFGTMEEFA
jgi:DNA-binding MarR family transcriptional regulator